MGLVRLLGALGLSVFVSWAVPGGGEAQILNTLRGWADPEPGWSGTLEAAVTLSRGNSEYLATDFAAELQLVRGRHRVRALAGTQRRTADGNEIAQQRIAHLRHNYQVRSWLASLVFAQFQENPFQRLEYRTLVGVGVRFDVYRSERLRAALGVSAMGEWEDVQNDAHGTRRTTRGSYFVSVVGNAGRAEIDLSAFYQPREANFGDARAFAAGDISVDIGAGLALRSGVDLTHDSRPPEGVEETDVRVTSGLAFSF
jgi:hypothetical protein